MEKNHFPYYLAGLVVLTQIANVRIYQISQQNKTGLAQGFHKHMSCFINISHLHAQQEK